MVLGILGPTAVVIGWLIVTYRYRLSKRKLVAEVVKRLQVDDIADSSAVALEPTPRIPRIFVTASRQLTAAGMLSLLVWTSSRARVFVSVSTMSTCRECWCHCEPFLLLLSDEMNKS